MRQSVQAKKEKATARMEERARAKEIGAKEKIGTREAKEIGVRAVKDGVPKDGTKDTEVHMINNCQSRARKKRIGRAYQKI